MGAPRVLKPCRAGSGWRPRWEKLYLCNGDKLILGLEAQLAISGGNNIPWGHCSRWRVLTESAKVRRPQKCRNQGMGLTTTCESWCYLWRINLGNCVVWEMVSWRSREDCLVMLVGVFAAWMWVRLAGLSIRCVEATACYGIRKCLT